MLDGSLRITDQLWSVTAFVLTLCVCVCADTGAVLLHAGDLQHLAWLGLQWALMEQSVSLQHWLKQLFPRLTLETSKLDTNAPESICLLDLEVRPPSSHRQ